MNAKEYIIKSLLPICVFLIILTNIYAAEKNKLELTIYSGYSLFDAGGSNPPCKNCYMNRNEYQFDSFPLNSQFISARYSINGSFLFGAKLGYYLNKNIEFEANIGIGPGHTFTKEFKYICPPNKPCILENELLFPIKDSENIIAYNYDSNLVYNFKTSSKFTAYLAAGLGGISYDINDEVKTMATINASIGLKYYFKNIGLRFELNERAILNHFISNKTEYNLQILYGIVIPL